MSAKNTASPKLDNVDHFLEDAETSLKEGIGSLVEWADQARSTIRNKPETLLAAAGISGLIAGTLLRHRMSPSRSADNLWSSETGSAHKIPFDPTIALIGGLAIGVLAGPRLIEQAFSAIDKFGEHDGKANTVDFESARSRATGTMNQRPFEK